MNKHTTKWNCEVHSGSHTFVSHWGTLLLPSSGPHLYTQGRLCWFGHLFLFLLHNWQLIPFGHITPVRMVVCWLMVYQLSFFEMILFSCLK